MLISTAISTAFLQLRHEVELRRYCSIYCNSIRDCKLQDHTTWCLWSPWSYDLKDVCQFYDGHCNLKQDCTDQGLGKTPYVRFWRVYYRCTVGGTLVICSKNISRTFKEILKFVNSSSKVSIWSSRTYLDLKFLKKMLNSSGTVHEIRE
jgi:hypothetical protein